jgi:hypothetical protein
MLSCDAKGMGLGSRGSPSGSRRLSDARGTRRVAWPRRPQGDLHTHDAVVKKTFCCAPARASASLQYSIDESASEVEKVHTIGVELRGVERIRGEFLGGGGEEEKRRPAHYSPISLSLPPPPPPVSLVQDELSKLGLKAGGTLQERAARLWRTRGVFSIKDLVKEAPELAAGGNVGGKKRGRRADESVKLVEERAERKLAKQQGPLLPGLGILPSPFIPPVWKM